MCRGDLEGGGELKEGTREDNPASDIGQGAPGLVLKPIVVKLQDCDTKGNLEAELDAPPVDGGGG